MTFNAHVEGGVIVPDEPVSLRNGEKVTVTLETSEVVASQRGKPGAELIANLRRNREPSGWDDIGDSAEFAEKLRQQSNTPRYRLDLD